MAKMMMKKKVMASATANAMKKTVAKTAVTKKTKAMKASKMATKKMSMKKKKMVMAKKKMSTKLRKMAMKKSKSVIAKGKRAKSAVFNGTKEKTVGGLKKGDLKKNKNGKVVSKKASDMRKKSATYKKFVAWGVAFKKARQALGIKGFCPCGGKTKQGQSLLQKTRSLYKK